MNKKSNPMGKILKSIFEFYPIMAPIAFLTAIIGAILAAVPDIFLQKILANVEKWYTTGDFIEAKKELYPLIIGLVIIYIFITVMVFISSRLMAVITQGVLKNLRERMFNKMQNLPIRYFDTHKTGDIMSYYTNDIDTLRQLISQAIPSILKSGIIIIAVVGVMIYYSLWMTLVLFVGIYAMMIVTKKVGGGSAKYFIKQQKSIGEMEGFIQEMMNGGKVVKVFNHEEESLKDFKELNNKLMEDSVKANSYANILMPLIANIGNLVYVLIAVAGALFILFKVPNVSISRLGLNISIVVPFLNMTKQFTGNIGQVSQQINAIVMGMAGANRIYEIIEEEEEVDEGKISLVYVKKEKDTLVESPTFTGEWAWKKVEDKSSTLVPLKGDVEFHNVDFGYNEKSLVLKDMTLYARPGQKVAFVGATGAGKTTITNLINRYYDINNGIITYDGIDVRDIKKSDLRKSLGIVLQDVNLFTGTVMENIRYGNLFASDEDCINAAELSGAHSFIERLPEGYNTMLYTNASNLSQGQKQLISIARAAVANPPVMILDEATSSIDTHTEALVQKGMDSLMQGRTVFVIAHRLSTVKNSDVIMVLDHGEIIERGNHEDLIKEKGVYYKLYTGAFELE